MLNTNTFISKLIYFLLISFVLTGCSDKKKSISFVPLALLGGNNNQ